MEWKDGTEIPPLKRGHMREYVVAVYRASTGKVYSFASSYLNAYPLRHDHDCPKGDGCEGIGCDDGCPTTGWFYQTGEDGDSSTFNSLDLRDGDRLEGWCEIPKWEDRNTISRLTAERDGIRAATIEECAKLADSHRPDREPSGDDIDDLIADMASCTTREEISASIRALATPRVTDAERVPGDTK